MMVRSRRSNQRPDTVMQDRIARIDETSCTARPGGRLPTERARIPPKRRTAVLEARPPDLTPHRRERRDVHRRLTTHILASRGLRYGSSRRGARLRMRPRAHERISPPGVRSGTAPRYSHAAFAAPSPEGAEKGTPPGVRAGEPSSEVVAIVSRQPVGGDGRLSGPPSSETLSYI